MGGEDLGDDSRGPQVMPAGQVSTVDRRPFSASASICSTAHTDTSAARFPRACHRIRRASRPDTKAAVTAMSADACPSEVTLRRSGGPFTDAETRPEVRGDP